MLTRAEVGLSLARSSRSKWDFVLDTLHILSAFIHFVISLVPQPTCCWKWLFQVRWGPCLLRDRLREALYEEGELGMILTFSEDSLTCCLPLPVLGSCPYHRLCLWWPRSRTSSCSSSSVILARFSLFSRSKELCRARRFPSTRAIFRFTSFSYHKKYCAEV